MMTNQQPSTDTRETWIYGGGGHSTVVAEVLRATGYSLAGFFDDNPAVWGDGPPPVRPGLQHDSQLVAKENLSLVIAVGNNRTRQTLAHRLHAHRHPSPQHPSAVVSPTAQIAPGTVVMQGSVVQAHAQIGHHVIINTAVSIDHDCVIADFAHISPQATLCGNVTIGIGAQVGAGAVVLPGRSVGPWAIVGAGAIVVRDVPPGAVVVGNPARLIRWNENSQETDDITYTSSPSSLQKAPMTPADVARQMLTLKTEINTVLANSGRPPVAELNPNLDLRRDLGLDSLELAELTVRLESRFGVDVFREGLVNTVGEVGDRLRRCS